MNKRGAELPLSTLIVIILVVIVLIVVAVFFLGGTSKLSESIRNIFYGTTAGTDLSLAVEICEQRCEQAKNLPDNLRSTSAYCRSGQNIDFDGDGKLEQQNEGATDGDEFDVLCIDSKLGVPCVGVSCQ